MSKTNDVQIEMQEQATESSALMSGGDSESIRPEPQPSASPDVSTSSPTAGGAGAATIPSVTVSLPAEPVTVSIISKAKTVSRASFPLIKPYSWKAGRKLKDIEENQSLKPEPEVEKLPIIHQAAVDGTLDRISRADINKRDRLDKTPLHYAIAHSQVKVAVNLINRGADFLLCDAEQLTPLHVLMKTSTRERNNFNQNYKIIESVLKQAVPYFRNKREPINSEEDIYPVAVKYIFSSDTSPKYGSILCYAARCSAYRMIEKITNIKDVYVKAGPDANCYEADVTDFFPTTQRQGCFSKKVDAKYKLKQTNNEIDGAEVHRSVSENDRVRYCNRLVERMPSLCSQRTDTDTDIGVPEEKLARTHKPSYVEYLLCGKERDIHKSLGIGHIKNIPNSFWRVSIIPEVIMAALHMAHMIVLSTAATSGFPENTPLCHSNMTDSSVSNVSNVSGEIPPQEQKWYYGLLALWPAYLMLVDVVYIIRYIIVFYRMGMLKQHLRMLFLSSSPRPSIWMLSGVVFHITSVIWISYFISQGCIERESLIFCLISGWLYVIHWTQFWKTVNHLSLVIHRVLVKDVIKFMMIFSVFLVAFTVAFRVQLTTLVRDPKQSLMENMFLMFNMAVGMASPDDMIQIINTHLYDLPHANINGTVTTLADNLDRDYILEQVSRVRWLCVSFIVVVFIVLLNMLIAIMNDSYSSVTTEFDRDWERNKIEGIVTLQRVFPWVIRPFARLKMTMIYGYIDEYHSIWISLEKSDKEAIPEDSNINTQILEKMKGLSKLVATLTERMEGIEDSMKLLKRSDNPSAERPYDDAEIDINHTEHL